MPQILIDWSKISLLLNWENEIKLEYRPSTHNLFLLLRLLSMKIYLISSVVWGQCIVQGLCDYYCRCWEHKLGVWVSSHHHSQLTSLQQVPGLSISVLQKSLFCVTKISWKQIDQGDKNLKMLPKQGKIHKIIPIPKKAKYQTKVTKNF